MQNPIEAVLNLRQRYSLEPDMVDQLTIYRRGRGHSGPLPQSGLDGKFSVEYCAAVALLDGKVVIDSFTDQRRFSPDMEEALGKIRVEPFEPEPGAVKVTARLKDGRTVSEECRRFRGSAANPMSREEHMGNIWDCVGRALPHQDIEYLITLLENLENVDDISTIMRILGKESPYRA
jgi:2-methylcitrate dehydratase PrpD